MINMKKILTFIIIAFAAANVYAQPRAMGARFGATGLEADYQHEIKRNQFIEGNLGLDFGALAHGKPGVKATATYNFIWARPAWTQQGSWAIYAGPGATLGYVNDSAHFTVGKEVYPYDAAGFMLGVCGQVGLEYTFWFPLQLSVDLRPTIGMHVSGKYRETDPVTGITIENDAHVGLYDTGFLGFCPSISVRYRF